MGWGDAPHERVPDGRRTDGTWMGAAWRGAMGLYDDPTAVQAICSCGWRGERIHEVGAPPEYEGTAARAAWSQRREQAEDACQEDWNAEHLQPLLGYEPDTQLILGRSEGGARHYLDGRPVHAGTPLELLVAGGTSVKLRYEWSWQQGEAPMAHLQFGGPAGAEQLGEAPQVSFPLPPRAVLRWPAGESAS